MSESNRLKLRQVTLLARIQMFREEQASRQVAAARVQMAHARQDVADAACAYEQDVVEQTTARHLRWQGCVGMELSCSTVRALRAEDKAGLASVEHHSMNQKKAQHAFQQAQSTLKQAEKNSVLIRNITARRNALKLRILHDYKKHEILHEEVMRDQQSQLLFAHRFVDNKA
nr:hypothetical protein [uncultured Acetobacter sp.]